MPQKISMRISTTSRIPASQHPATQPRMLGGGHSSIQSSFGRMSMVNLVHNTPSGCSSCGGR